jgi:hypothetical protein
MATLHSITSGSFSAASTWGVVDPTSLLDTRAGTNGPITTTTTNTSAVFTPGAITIIGVSIQIIGRITSPTGTITMRLWNNTAGSIVKDVTINASDLPNTGGTTTAYVGWTYFKFDTSVTLLAGTAYAIRMFSSVNNEIAVYTDGTANNYSRALITSTTQAPASTDVLIISGQHTAAGTFTPYAVTMNITSNAVSYGQSYVGSRGTLSYGVAASTNYALKLAGSLYVGQGGTLNIGATGAAIPANSSATLELSCVSAGQFSIFVYGTMTTYGATKTIASKLASDVAIGATGSTSTTSTLWKSGDVIVVPSTTRTYTEFEAITLNADASTTTLTHSAYAAAHGGNATTKVQADIVNATRNITILSTSTTFRTVIQIFTYSTTSFYYTKFQDLGVSTTITTSGINVNALTAGIGTFDFQGNVVTTTVVQSAILSANIALFTSSSTGTTISNNLFYKLGWTTLTSTISCTTINDGNYFIGCLCSLQIIFVSFVGSNNVFSSNFSNGYAANIGNFVNNSSNNSFYSNTGGGFYYANQTAGIGTFNTNISGLKVWRNTLVGIYLTNQVIYNRANIASIVDSYIFGNGTAGIGSSNRTSGKFYFSNCYIYGGSTLVQPYAISNSTIYAVDTLYFDNCYFGYSDSVTLSANGTAVIQSPAAGVTVIFSNCKFNGTEVIYSTGFSMINIESSSTSFKHGGATGLNKTWYNNGVLSTDSVIFNNSSPSIRMTPANATYKLTQPTVKIPVKSGKTCTIGVKIRKSVTGDGTYYNGAKPRLIYSFNPALGNLTETIGATGTNNLYTFPQNFDNAIWVKQGGTITADSASVAAPDGTLTADLFTEDSISTRHGIYYNGLILPSGVYTVSVYAKKASQDWIQLYPATSNWSSDWANFNLTTGAIGNKGASTIATITNVSNGWWRISMQATFSNPGVADFMRLYFATGNTNSVTPELTYTGTSAQCFYTWGAQLTSGSTLLPYYDNGSWEPLSYTTPTFSGDGVAEFYVDCDGTAGWINVDDWITTTSNDSRGTDYWYPSGTYIESDWRKPGGSRTFAG